MKLKEGWKSRKDSYTKEYKLAINTNHFGREQAEALTAALNSRENLIQITEPYSSGYFELGATGIVKDSSINLL